jgi:hypothetical protein
MPNLIKSATTVSTGTIKKNNFLISVDTSLQYGPTESTGFWSGIVPPTSGYTVYAQKQSQGPSIRVASTDSELITIAKQYSGTSINTANDALNFFNGQSQYMVTNIDYENIVTNGLVFLLDAGYIPSYSRSGTTWSDLSGNGNNGTLTNGPTFSSDNGGSIVFDGVNDYAPIGTSQFPFGTSSGTLSSWARTSTVSGSWRWIVSYGSPNIPQARFIGINNSTYYFGGYGDDITASGVILNTWFNMVGVYNGTNASIYINGVLVSGPTAKSWNTVAGNAQIGRQISNIEHWNGRISNVFIYNRALTATEVLQNYNAQKGRFGL